MQNLYFDTPQRPQALIPTTYAGATMPNGAPGNSSSPPSPILSHENSHTFSHVSANPTTTSLSTGCNPTSSTSSTTPSTQDSGRLPSRAPSVSSVSSVGPLKTVPKITPVPTTQKQKHYWVPYAPEMDSTGSGSSLGPSSGPQVDDIVSKATGEDFNGLSNDSIPAAPPAPPPVRYTRTGQIIPEGKVMMINGGCVGESDWKRTNGAIQSMFEPLHHVLTAEGQVPMVLPSNGFWLRAMTDEAVVELCRAYGIEVEPDGDPRKIRAAFLNYLGATYLAAVV